MRLRGERKRKISALRKILYDLGYDSSHWNWLQFKIDGASFILNEDKYRYNLVAKKKCEYCKTHLYSFPITNLVELGRILANENAWSYHYCPPHDGPKKVKPQATPEEKAYALVAELIELVGGEFLAFREKE